MKYRAVDHLDAVRGYWARQWGVPGGGWNTIVPVGFVPRDGEQPPPMAADQNWAPRS